MSTTAHVPLFALDYKERSQLEKSAALNGEVGIDIHETIVQLHLQQVGMSIALKEQQG